MDRLTERQEQLLRLIVHEYVSSGRAVGSKMLVESYHLSVSSATIRNEMGELERAGLIDQPHTSAGRVPTDRGYRYYIERLIGEPRLSSTEEMMIRHQFRQVEMQLEGWMQLAVTTLARSTGNVSVVTAPRVQAQTARVKHFDLVGIQDHVVLLVLVTHESGVKQSFLHWHDMVTQPQLRAISDRLNTPFAGVNAADAAALAAREEGLARLVAESIAERLRELDTETSVELQHAGLEHALQQPEFAGGQAAGQFVELLRGGGFLSALLPQVQPEPADNVQVFIGTENIADSLHPYGIVVATYGVRHEVIGLVGVLGPRRMPYERSIGSVRYISGLMSDLVGRLYGAEPFTTEPYTPGRNTPDHD
ncbi:MAG: heat-inducible transcriptional repressor HrcA [Thermomicrobiales bacterium]